MFINNSSTDFKTQDSVLLGGIKHMVASSQNSSRVPRFPVLCLISITVCEEFHMYSLCPHGFPIASLLLPDQIIPVGGLAMMNCP